MPGPGRVMCGWPCSPALGVGCILGRAGDMTSSEVVLEAWWEAGGFRTSCSQQTEVFRIWPSHSADGHGWHGGRILVPPGRV